MFITDARARHPFMSALLDDGMQAWNSINLSIEAEWFWVSYLLKMDEGRIRETILLSSLSQVVEVFEQAQGDRIEILEVNIVSPPYLNRSTHWMLEPLREVWRARNPRTGRVAHLYCVAEGKEYVEADNALEEFTERQLLLKVSQSY